MLFRSNDTATTEIYTGEDTLSLHDALPIYVGLAVLSLAFTGLLSYALRRQHPAAAGRG